MGREKITGYTSGYNAEVVMSGICEQCYNDFSLFDQVGFVWIEWKGRVFQCFSVG
jgi:hypothetical protein